MSICALSHLVFGSMIVTAYHYDSWIGFRSAKLSLILVAGGLSSAAAADILIASSLTYFIRQNQGDLSVRFNSALNRLIGFIVGTGMLTALTSIGTIIAFSLDKQNGVFIGMSVLQSKVYANSLLTNLNLRRNRNVRVHLGHHVEFTTVICQGISTQSSYRADEMIKSESPRPLSLA